MRNKKLDAANSRVAYVDRITAKDLIRLLSRPELKHALPLPEVLVPHELYDAFVALAQENGHETEDLVRSLIKSYVFDQSFPIDDEDEFQIDVTDLDKVTAPVSNRMGVAF